MTGNNPLIVTATFDAADFQWLDALRRAHYPAGRNQVPAHLTMFQHLPPSELDFLKTMLKAEARIMPPSARLISIRTLDHGVAFVVDSPELFFIRNEMADRLAPLLLPNDRAHWWPHVTIQNKVEPAVARALANSLAKDFMPRPLSIAGLALWAYQNGPWEMLAHYRFRPGR